MEGPCSSQLALASSELAPVAPCRTRQWQILAAVITVLCSLAVAAPAFAWPICGC